MTHKIQGLAATTNKPTPMWKEDELWVKRKEWDNAKHLLDRTVVRVG